MASPFTIGRTIRGTRRARHILTVLVRYGFRSVIEDLNLDLLVLKGRKLVGGAEPEETVSREPTAVRLRHAMEELGPTFVKLGQVLSMRPDLIPPGWAEEFEKLQDDVPASEFAKVRAVLEHAYDDFDQVIRTVEAEPMAAASIAQVHRAVLADGSPVVLKILRPDIRRTVEADLDILRVIAEFIEEHFADLGYSPMEVVEQFSKEIERELDLVQEGRSAERLGRSFADNDQVLFPTVHWSATTSSVLAMDEIHGTPLSRLEPDDLEPETLERIVANGTDAVFRQCLEIGFFHADPHPGNIFALENGRICFLDCGMVGHIDPDTAELLADLVHGVISGDLNRVIDVVLTLGNADPALGEERAFRADVWAFISRFEGATFDRLDMGHLLKAFFERVREHKLKCPADIVFLIKAITTIEGVGERLMPEFDIVGHVRPYVERLVRRRYGIGALRRRLQDGLLAYGNLVERLPGHIRALLFSLRRERFTINLEHRGLDTLTETIDRAAGNIAHAVFIASLVMGSSILVLADSAAGQRGILSWIAGVGFVVALILLVARLVANRFHHHH